MGELRTLNQSEKRPRKIGETEWSENGLRLPAVRKAIDQGWFWPLMATLPLGAFVLVFFW